MVWLLILLPRKGWWWFCLILLLGYYVVYGYKHNPEHLPGIGPRAVIWVMYCLFGGLLVRFLRRAW